MNSIIYCQATTYFKNKVTPKINKENSIIPFLSDKKHNAVKEFKISKFNLNKFKESKFELSQEERNTRFMYYEMLEHCKKLKSNLSLKNMVTNEEMMNYANNVLILDELKNKFILSNNNLTKLRSDMYDEEIKSIYLAKEIYEEYIL